MEVFDVLKMWNILNFHLDHSNCYLFYFLKFQDPLKSSGKKSSDYGVHSIQNEWLGLTVSTQKLGLKNMHWFPRYWPKFLKI